VGGRDRRARLRHGPRRGDGVLTLPPYIDDVSRDFGLDVYERMLVDAQVAACLAILKASIIEEGVTLAPAVDDEADPEYKQAREIADEAEAMLDDLDTPLDDVLWDLLGAIALGNRSPNRSMRHARPRRSRTA
jgi:hypothetical protein